MHSSIWLHPITFLSLGPLIHVAFARRGLNPSSLSILTRATDYTFHSICADFRNPDMYFDELEIFKVINAITNDLSMYMWGSSISRDGPHGLPIDPNDHSKPVKVAPRDRPWPYDALNEQTYASPKVMRVQQGGERDREKGKEKVDCGKFRKDLRDFSTSFSSMVYAVSEKVNKNYVELSKSRLIRSSATANATQAVMHTTQCKIFSEYLKTTTTGLLIPRLASRVAFSQPSPHLQEYTHNSTIPFRPLTPFSSQGFYRQIREIEAETNCRFHDHFLIENERAVDYTKIWIETFQRHVTPCANIKGAGNDSEADAETPSDAWSQWVEEKLRNKGEESRIEEDEDRPADIEDVVYSLMTGTNQEEEGVKGEQISDVIELATLEEGGSKTSRCSVDEEMGELEHCVQLAFST